MRNSREASLIGPLICEKTMPLIRTYMYDSRKIAFEKAADV